jgi:hypothetical protein
MNNETRKIAISSDLHEILTEKAAKTKFESVDAYTEHILRQILQTDTEDNITREEEEAIKERLRSLGYL